MVIRVNGKGTDQVEKHMLVQTCTQERGKESVF